MYEPRWYRQYMGARFQSLEYKYLETDIWMAYDITCSISKTKIIALIDKKTKELHRLFNDHFYIHSEFKHSLIPVEVDASYPKIIQELCEISQKTEVGPMAGIAAVFAREIAILCKNEFHFEEIIVENGGDIYMDIRKDISVLLYAGNHPLSNKMHIVVEANDSPLGLCASSGTFGHSLSLGKADLVAVACKDPILADQLATALANQILKADDIKKVLNIHTYDKDILSLLIFADNEFGMKGKFRLKEF